MGFPTHNVKSTLPQTNVIIDQQVQTVKHTTTKVIKKAKSDTRAPRYAMPLYAQPPLVTMHLPCSGELLCPTGI